MRTILKKEDGNSFLLMALGMMLTLAILGLVVDGGHLYMTKSHMQKTANAAALSGAQELPNSSEKVNQVVGEILNHHGEADSLLFSNIEGDSQLHVGVGRDVPLFFSSLFGIDSVMIGADAKAGLHAMTAGFGAVPLGLDEKEVLEINYEDPKVHKLKVGAGDSETGNFGILALEGPGGKSYGEALMHGFDGELRVGEVVDTQTGNIAGKTRDGVTHRMNNCPYPDGDYQQRDCARIMLIPVYKALDSGGKQVKSVEITGFAYFYLTKQTEDDADSIEGIFIRRAGPGESDGDAPLDRGAYTIKLTR